MAKPKFSGIEGEQLDLSNLAGTELILEGKLTARGVNHVVRDDRLWQPLSEDLSEHVVIDNDEQLAELAIGYNQLTQGWSDIPAVVKVKRVEAVRSRITGMPYAVVDIETDADETARKHLQLAGVLPIGPLSDMEGGGKMMYGLIHGAIKSALKKNQLILKDYTLEKVEAMEAKKPQGYREAQNLNQAKELATGQFSTAAIELGHALSVQFQQLKQFSVGRLDPRELGSVTGVFYQTTNTLFRGHKSIHDLPMLPEG